MKIVEKWPLSPGEMFQDLKGKWFVCCPHCGTVSNSNRIDNWFECPECHTISMTPQQD